MYVGIVPDLFFFKSIFSRLTQYAHVNIDSCLDIGYKMLSVDKSKGNGYIKCIYV